MFVLKDGCKTSSHIWEMMKDLIESKKKNNSLDLDILSGNITDSISHLSECSNNFRKYTNLCNKGFETFIRSNEDDEYDFIH